MLDSVCVVAHGNLGWLLYTMFELWRKVISRWPLLWPRVYQGVKVHVFETESAKTAIVPQR